MPMIDSKITLKVSEEKRNAIVKEFGKAVSILGKPESYLMCGIHDEYDLYFAGEKLECGAFVSVDLFGGENPQAFEKFTAKLCEIFQRELKIPGEKIYVKYGTTRNWGWNGSNF
jgi:hypothetical protein